MSIIGKRMRPGRVLLGLGLGWGLAAWAGGGVRAAEFDCVVEARRIVNLGAPIEARIETIHVERGDFVKRGDVLVEFDTQVERATAELARYRAEMQGGIEARKAQRDFASAKHRRQAELTEQRYLSPQALDEAHAELKLSDAELREAEDARRLAELEHRRALELLNQRVLRSPVHGVVVERSMQPGEVSELGRKPILRIAELGTLHVEAILPTEAYRQVARGDSATVRLDPSLGGGSHPATVRVVDRLLDAASGTFGVRLELPNPDRSIPAGARCRVELPKVSAPARAGARRSAAPAALADAPAPR